MPSSKIWPMRWGIGVPLWAEVEPHCLTQQGCRESFAGLVAVNFDRFIDSHELVRLGEQAQPVPIGELEGPIGRTQIGSRRLVESDRGMLSQSVACAGTRGGRKSTSVLPCSGVIPSNTEAR
jgi:hypothetical protein